MANHEWNYLVLGHFTSVVRIRKILFICIIQYNLAVWTVNSFRFKFIAFGLVNPKIRMAQVVRYTHTHQKSFRCECHTISIKWKMKFKHIEIQHLIIHRVQDRRRMKNKISYSKWTIFFYLIYIYRWWLLLLLFKGLWFSVQSWMLCLPRALNKTIEYFGASNKCTKLIIVLSERTVC